MNGEDIPGVAGGADDSPPGVSWSWRCIDDGMNNLRILGVALMGVATLATGCGGPSSTAGESTACESRGTTGSDHGSGGMAMTDMCPMQIPGTTVASIDVDLGVALAFTTSSGDVGELRSRVARMAEMHNHRHAAGGMMPAATATAEDIADGARMILRPNDPAQLDALREHARMHAERMSHGECPMLMECAGDHTSPHPQ